MLRGAAFSRRAVPLLLCVAALAPSARAEEPSVRVVARVEGRELTYEGLCLAAVERARHRLTSIGSLATTHLRNLIDRRRLEHHARRLGVGVTDADVDARMAEYEAQVKEKYEGRTTLSDLMAEREIGRDEFRNEARTQLLKERVATEQPRPEDPPVAFSIPTCLGGVRAMKPGVLAEVGEPGSDPLPITTVELGNELLRVDARSDEKEILYEVVESMLLDAAGFDLTDAEFDEEIELQREHWSVYRKLADQAALERITYDDWFDAKYRMTIAQMKTKRYWRGYFALVRHMRASTTAEAARTR